MQPLQPLQGGAIRFDLGLAQSVFGRRGHDFLEPTSKQLDERLRGRGESESHGLKHEEVRHREPKASGVHRDSAARKLDDG